MAKNPPSVERRKISWVKWTALVAFIACVTAVGLRFYTSFQAVKHSIDTEIRRIQNAGEPVSREDLSAWYTARTPNGSNLIFEIVRQHEAPEEFGEARRFIWNWSDSTRERPTASVLELSKAYLRENEACFALIAEFVSSAPMSCPERWTLDEQHRVESLTFWNDFSFLSASLRLRSVVHAESNDLELAIDDLLTALRLSEAFRGVPSLEAQVSRLSSRSSLLRSVEYHINNYPYSEGSLSKLHAEFSKLYDHDALRIAMLGERSRVVSLHSWSQRNGLSRIDGSYFFAHYDFEYRLNAYRKLIEMSDADPDLRTREFDFWLHQLSRLWPEPRANWPILLPYEFVHPDLDWLPATHLNHPSIHLDSNHIKSKHLLWLRGALKNSEEIEVFVFADRTLYATLLLIGMERYRLAKGELPDELDQLVPVFVERPPVNLVGEDPFDMTSDDEYIYITEKEKPALPDSPVKVEMRKKRPAAAP
ncbi:MAG TPA: hypothetical protein PLJ47_04520 [Candidatus Hydrogenedentes bacterium]|nr:hypothetical protein [Candidatus Hydrogenedentota bacterium]